MPSAKTIHIWRSSRAKTPRTVKISVLPSAAPNSHIARRQPVHRHIKPLGDRCCGKSRASRVSFPHVSPEAMVARSVPAAMVPVLPLWRAVFLGEAIGPFDQIRQMAPWNGPAPAQAWDVLQADGVLQFYGWRGLVFESWGKGQLPLWNPYQLCGTPLLADSTVGSVLPAAHRPGHAARPHRGGHDVPGLVPLVLGRARRSCFGACARVESCGRSRPGLRSPCPPLCCRGRRSRA